MNLRPIHGLGLIVVLAVAVGVIALRDGVSDSPPTVDASFTYFDGSEGRLSDFRGTPLVVNFWASWCPACVSEMPDFETVHTQLGDRVVFLGMNMQEIDPEAASELVKQTGVTYRLALDPKGEIYSQFGGIGMPTTLFIDAAGRLVDVHAGVLFKDDLLAKIQTELLES